MIALYTRVSTQEQAEHGYSITEQTERLKSYCNALKWHVYKLYTDAGYSGANTARPGLQALIKDVRAGKIEKVLVYKLDRLSRSQKDTLELIEDIFLKSGTDFVSISENFDTSTPFGRAIIGILAVFAQLEREQIKERMSLGMTARARAGKWHGGFSPPIGYDYVNNQLIINDYEALQIQKIFEMALTGMSPYKIAGALNSAGYRHGKGHKQKWNNVTVRHALNQRAYIGYLTFNGKSYKGDHETIITEELFNAVQRVRDQIGAQHLKNYSNPGSATSYFGGFLYCAKCGAKYGKASRYKTLANGTKKRYERYECYSRGKHQPQLIKDPNCKNKIWNMQELDNAIFKEIKKLTLQMDQSADPKNINDHNKKIEAIRTELNRLDDQINRALDLYTIEEIPIETVQDRIKKLNDQKLSLSAEMDAIAEAEEKKLSKAEVQEIVKSFADILERGTFEEIRATIGALIERVVIDNDDLTIYWNF